MSYPVSGLKGDLLRVPTLGLSFGLSSIAELQIDGGLYNRLNITSRQDAPLSDQLDFTGDKTSAVEDIVVATKIRLLSETPGRPAFGVRFATRLPNASNESGLGLDTTDFFVAGLLGKTVQSIRFVGNVGLGILADPVRGDSQNDVLTYGLSVARAVRQGLEVVGEINGRLDTRDGDPPVGLESRGAMRLGAPVHAIDRAGRRRVDRRHDLPRSQFWLHRRAHLGLQGVHHPVAPGRHPTAPPRVCPDTAPNTSSLPLIFRRIGPTFV